MKKLCIRRFSLDLSGAFCYTLPRRGSSRREESRDWIDILGFPPVQPEMTRLFKTGSASSFSDFCAGHSGNDRTEVIFMGIGELLLLAVGVSMDAFAVSICKGLAMKKATLKASMTCGVWFGGFQALMPTIGFFWARCLPMPSRPSITGSPLFCWASSASTC